MISILLNKVYTANEAVCNMQKQQHKMEVQRLESQIKNLENRVEYFQQLLIFEQRKNTQLKGTVQ